MVVKPEKLVLEIPFNINEYRFFIEQSCDFVSNISGVSENYGKMARYKLVIMELLTNAMKHCKQTSHLSIEKSQLEIIIKKTDYGNRFSFSDYHTNIVHQLPIDDFVAEREIEILFANNYKMPLKIRNRNSVEFLPAKEVIFQSIMDIPEHFGLMIIRQCADFFYYHFDEDNKQNTFEVIFKF